MIATFAAWLSFTLAWGAAYMFCSTLETKQSPKQQHVSGYGQPSANPYPTRVPPIPPGFHRKTSGERYDIKSFSRGGVIASLYEHVELCDCEQGKDHRERG